MWLDNTFLLCYLFLDPSDKVQYDHVSSLQVDYHLPSRSCLSEQQSIHKKLLTFNTIRSLGFPVMHLPALLRYRLNTYGATLFMEVFVISQLTVNIFQPICFSVMPFPDALNMAPKSFNSFSIWYITWSLDLTLSPLNSAYIFSWSKSKILFCLNYSILCWYLITLALVTTSFASVPQSQFSIIFFSLYIFHLIHSIFVFFFNPSSPLTSLFRKLTSFLSHFISPSIPCFHLCSFLVLSSAFFYRICPAIWAVAALINFFVSLMLLLFKYLIASLTVSVWIF